MLDSKFFNKTAISILYAVTLMVFILLHEYAHVNINWAFIAVILCLLLAKIIEKYGGDIHKSNQNDLR